MKFNKVLTILLVLSCVLILNFCEKPKTVADPHKNAANRKSAVVAAESKTKIPPAGAKSNKTKKSKTKKSKSKKKSKDKNKSKGKKHYPKAGCNSKKNKKNQFYGFMCNLLPHLDANMDDHEGLDGCMLKLWKKGDSTDDVGSEAAFRDNNRNYQSVYNHIDQSTVLPCKAFKQDLKTYMKKGSGINRFAKVFVEYTPKPQHKNGVDKCLDELKSRNFLQKSIDLVKSPIVKGAKQVFKCLKKTKKVKPSFIANVDKFNKSLKQMTKSKGDYIDFFVDSMCHKENFKKAIEHFRRGAISKDKYGRWKENGNALGILGTNSPVPPPEKKPKDSKKKDKKKGKKGKKDKKKTKKGKKDKKKDKKDKKA